MGYIKYRLHCTTDAVYEYWILPDTDPVPTTCPTNTGHTITPNSLAIVDTIGPSEVEIVPKIGGMRTSVDGIAITVGGANLQGHALYQVPTDFHVQGTQLGWSGFATGDYGWLDLIHPASIGALQVALVGTNVVTVGLGLGAYYDPLAGAESLDIWDAGGNVVECHGIVSVIGDVITLDANLTATYDVTHTTRARYQTFSPTRGASGIEGGFRLVGMGTEMIRHENAITEAIPAGLMLGAHLVTGAAAGTRELSLNFITRLPL